MKVDRSVQRWLFIGVVLILVQIVLGGITRLTDSGLSITEWKVIQGTLPPLNDVEWNESFDLYKAAAKKQFTDLHSNMQLADYKWIFFWEYFHRLWARFMGFVFLFPFLFFLVKGMLPKVLIRRLIVVILLAILAAVFGIIMVYSGLNDDTRTWVSAYKLTTHLLIATVLLGYLFVTWKLTLKDIGKGNSNSFISFLVVFIFLQILMGGLMAGMRAALVHPYFSIFSHFAEFKFIIFSSDISDVGNYESNASLKAIVQIFHRGFAYCIFGLVVFGLIKSYFRNLPNRSVYMFVTLLISQIILGIFTISFSIGHIPVVFGALHQITGLLLFLSVLNLKYSVEM